MSLKHNLFAHSKDLMGTDYSLINQAMKRYLFVFNFDFFSAEVQTIRGPSASCGIISAACLNLPLSIRYKPENMYITCIIPGLAEPHGTALNHYIQLVVDDLLTSWTHGVRYSCTANHPHGRMT